MVQLYTSEVVATIVSVAVEHHAEAHLRLRLTANDPFGHLWYARRSNYDEFFAGEHHSEIFFSHLSHRS